MVSNYNLDSSNFESLRTVSRKMFEAITKQLDVNTAYVTKKSKTEMTVVSSYNENEEIIPEGYSVEYGGTYCRLIIENDKNALSKLDVTKDEATRRLEVTDQLQVKGFLGVTLRDLNGKVFGTLCVIDKAEKEFSEKDVEYLESMADILSHIIELDQTKYNMAFLNVPIIPITKGISTLTIQGVIDQYRSEKIMRVVLRYSAEHQIDHFIIDVSGLVILDDLFPCVIVDLVKALQVMGIETILTGISPEIARHEDSNKQLLSTNIKTVPNLESALEYIGFYLLEK